MLSGGQFLAAWHCHSPDTPAAAATQNARTSPAEERRGQLAPGSVREHWSKAVSIDGGRDRAHRPVRERFKSRAFPALASPVLREHPCCRPSSSSASRPPALPSQPPPQALKDTAARWPATPGRSRVEGSRRAPRPARGSPRRPALPGAALAHRPVLLVLPVAADGQPGKAAGSQRPAAAGAPAAAPGAEQQQERSTCGGRHLSTGNGAGPGSAADGRGVTKTRHSAAPGQLQS